MSTLGVAGSAFGGPSLLPTNHSFEAEGPEFVDSEADTTAVPGWVAIATGGGAFYGTANDQTATYTNRDGANFFYLRGDGTTAATAVTAAASRAPITAGEQYQLSFQARNDITDARVDDGTTVDLQFFSGTGDAATPIGTFSSGLLLANGPTSGNASEFTVFGAAPTGATHAGVRISTTGGFIYDDFDLTVVPEPASAALLSLGGLLLLRRGRRQA